MEIEAILGSELEGSYTAMWAMDYDQMLKLLGELIRLTGDAEREKIKDKGIYIWHIDLVDAPAGEPYPLDTDLQVISSMHKGRFIQ